MIMDCNPTGTELKQRITEEAERILNYTLALPKRINVYMNHNTVLKIFSEGFTVQPTFPIKLEYTLKNGTVVNLLTCNQLEDNVIEFGHVDIRTVVNVYQLKNKQ